MAQPEILYHYTGEAPLISILSGQGAEPGTGVIWASDALFLNDSKELLAGRKPLKRALNAFLSRCATNPELYLDGTSTHNLRSAVDYFLKYVEEFGTGIERPPRVFVASFCESPDLLSQWRSYGQDGYCIGFDRAALEQLVKPAGFKFPSDGDFYSQPVSPKIRKVAYTSAESSAALEDNMRQVLGPSGGGLRGWQSFGELAMLELMACIKAKSFKSEKEWRLIYVRRGGNLGWIDMPYRQSDLRPAAAARSGKHSAVPFLEMQFPKSAIRSIRVGPGGQNKLRRLAVQRVCEDLELEIAIKSSKIPYRG